VKNGLQEGDLIQKVDGTRVQSVDSLTQYLSSKKEGEKVKVEVIRDQKKMELNIPLVSLPTQKGDEKRVGLGIYPILRMKVLTNPPAKIDANEIGGPSAGLMFSLEILDRLLKEPLTKGYRIAGTGTISETGEVGQIGGIQHKVVAADREGAEIFFCPRDQTAQDDNEELAKATAARIKTDMIIVPVSTLQEAVDYLSQLPTK
jgi:PDZ domain-containing protein